MQRIPCRIVWHDVMGNIVCDNICYGFVDVEQCQTFDELQCVSLTGRP